MFLPDLKANARMTKVPLVATIVLGLFAPITGGDVAGPVRVVAPWCEVRVPGCCSSGDTSQALGWWSWRGPSRTGKRGPKAVAKHCVQWEKLSSLSYLHPGLGLHLDRLLCDRPRGRDSGQSADRFEFPPL
ncbi:hypothetical protein ElyMa_003715800 [Elysia marginata]|uniref:Secreted protein n=1 Tax=Elysia marginata TaxID=1093978 RepID=A0AAV4F4X7_9GAST|nr:hypothetical protein ElyMa_003715800 [Elysia marginata]